VCSLCYNQWQSDIVMINIQFRELHYKKSVLVRCFFVVSILVCVKTVTGLVFVNGLYESFF